MTPDQQLQAAAHLSEADPRLALWIARVGPPQMRREPDAWRALAASIIGQQISTKAASAIRGRFAALIAGQDYPLPADVLALSDEALRSVGLSGNKARGLKDLAAHFADGRLSNEALSTLDDEAVIARLIPVRGVGRWTAEMFLIFSLGRADVWAVDDLGLRAGIKRLDGLDAPPDKAATLARGEAWRPYRSLASWYLWRGLEI